VHTETDGGASGCKGAVKTTGVARKETIKEKNGSPRGTGLWRSGKQTGRNSRGDEEGREERKRINGGIKKHPRAGRGAADRTTDARSGGSTRRRARASEGKWFNFYLLNPLLFNLYSS